MGVAAIRFSPESVVSSWLSGCALEHYTHQFLAAGFFNLQSIQMIEELDLDMIGISSSEDRETLMNQVRNLRSMDLAGNSNSLCFNSEH